ncbi:Ni/Fe-hydrogenase, b-type cytochrome subunit [Thalassovita gelatinovora]|uniref:Ni/Fe-hydrogenase, b-type cytochrome subunit n=1 Tax=Thalassovita gelatinovora TaxID=53501 RepID=A0A0P1FHJ3_THAGE|nr:cytochrome b/b6 domain-containing protein [Thalassovita gelatinovora]QIZ81998.1 cytochrome B [Thalassovita gelatinovora]CUH67449.1 Ni/Fe-hydrogenase, b-type cytochrome subunit [Thalassovita gelatinovora]SEP73769.1 Cytochrome b [Thalassovita gelatinovora]
MTDPVTQDAGPAAQGSLAKVRVWDPLIRVFHWGLVAAFAVAYLSAEELSTLHELAGYVVAGLVAFRLIWGLVGSRYARFAQFLKGPAASFAYLGDMARGRERRYLGHNPAGAAMTLALLITLSGTAFTGWLLEEPTRIALLPDLPQIVAPAFADDDGEEREHGLGREAGESAVEEAHEVLANLMLFLIAVHVGGVVLASFRHRENLARAMVTGDKRAPGPGDIA